MISIAWSISLLLCIPQAFIFQGDKCQANFAPGWGLKAYVSWFSISNFFLPLGFLLFCYTRICYDIWENGKLKMKDENGQKKQKTKKGYFRHLKNCVKRQGGVPTAVTMNQDNQTIVVEDPDAIMAFEKLRRKPSDASSDDSSIESADRNMLRVS